MVNGQWSMVNGQWSMEAAPFGQSDTPSAKRKKKRLFYWPVPIVSPQDFGTETNVAKISLHG